MSTDLQHFWRAGEETLLAGVPAAWREHLGSGFDLLTGKLLQKSHRPAKQFPCQHCACWHDIIDHGRGDLVAVCACDIECDDIKLTPPDVTIWEVDLGNFGKAIARTLGCQPHKLDFHVQLTTLIGVSGTTPVVLSVASGKTDLRFAVMEVALAIKQPFALLTPTSRHLTPDTLAILNGSGAKSFDLESILTLLPSGTFEPRRPGSDFFTQFTMSDRVPGPNGTTQLLKELHQEIATIRTEYHQTRRAKEQLEKMRVEGLFKNLAQVDADSFRICCAVMAYGDVAKASRALNVNDTTIRKRIATWRHRGAGYRLLLEYLRWRKSIARRDPVNLSQDILGGRAAGTDYAGLLSDLLDEILTVNSDNYAEKCEELATLLRPYIQR